MRTAGTWSSLCLVISWISRSEPAGAQSCLLHTDHSGAMPSPYTSYCENHAIPDPQGCKTTQCKALVDGRTPICCTSVCCSNPVATKAVQGTCASSGSVYTQSSGTLSDGNGSYAPDKTCNWTISTGTEIQLSFSEFDTDQYDDFLRIYDGTDDSTVAIGVFHGGSLPRTVRATSGSMFVKFTSDYTGANQGFVATW